MRDARRRGASALRRGSASIDRALQVHGIPQNDGGHDEIQATRTIALVFIGSAADFAEAIEEHPAAQRVVLLAFVQSYVTAAPQLRACIHSRVNKVRSTLPSSRSAWAIPFWR